MKPMDNWLLLGGCVFTLVLASIFALILTIVFRKKIQNDATYIFWGLVPLELVTVFFGWPIAIAFVLNFAEIF